MTKAFKYPLQWIWFFISILANAIGMIVAIFDNSDEQDDKWYSENFGLDGPLMREKTWDHFRREEWFRWKRPFHEAKRCVKDWIIQVEDADQGKRAAKFLCFLVVLGPVLVWIF